MAKIFISYAREDRSKAQQLARVFEDRGWSVWWDTRLRAGEVWDEVIERELTAAHCVVVLWSRISVGKHWVRVEANEGLQRSILIPALIENVRPPLAFRLVQAEFLIDWSGDRSDAGLVRLLAAIGDRLEGQGGEADRPAPGPAAGASHRNEWPPGKAFRDIEAPWCPELVVLPAGDFLMGSPEDEKGRRDSEGPQHRVTIGSRFALGRYPVTVGEYRQFVEASGRRHQGGIYAWTGSEWKQDVSKSWQDPGFDQTDRHPVAGVSWQDAQAYVGWLAKKTGKPYRLPSEAEWEYACRAGTTTPFSFGETLTTDQANYHGNYVYGNGRKGVYRQQTTAVGSFPANPWGLFDMHGNVWEWEDDVWHNNYQGAPTDGSAWADGEGTHRVLRGGSWDFNPRYLRSAFRSRLHPEVRGTILGFRVARTLD